MAARTKVRKRPRAQVKTVPAPSPKAPSRKRGVLRVKKLLDAASAVFSERGFEATTMTEVAKRAGAAIGTLYQFFPTKESIADVLRARYGDAICAKWNALTDSDQGRNGKELAHCLFQITTDTLKEHPSFAALMVVRGNPGVNVSKVRKRYADALTRLLASRMPNRTASELHASMCTVRQIVRVEIDIESEPDAKERTLVRTELESLLSVYLAARMAPN